MAKRLVAVGIALTILSMMFIMRAPVQAGAALPTFTLAPTATLDPGAFSLVGAATFKGPNDVIEVLLPKLWAANPVYDATRYRFYFGDAQSPMVVLEVDISVPENMSIDGKNPTNARETLQDLHASFEGQIQAGQVPAESIVTAIAPVMIGTRSGFGYVFTVPDETGQPGGVVDLRIADLPDGKILFTISQSSNAAWVKAKPVLTTMLSSLVVRPDAIPTITPTPTPIPLKMTEVWLQSQLSTIEAEIEALTATPTLLPK